VLFAFADVQQKRALAGRTGAAARDEHKAVASFRAVPLALWYYGEAILYVCDIIVWIWRNHAVAVDGP